jgi:hypothetical protein
MRTGFAAALLLLPAVAHAEVEQTSFDCRATLFCDGAGSCQPTDESMTTFYLTRYDASTYTVAYGPIEADATVPYDRSLIVWTESDGTTHSLSTTVRPSPGRVRTVWQILLPDRAVLRFLDCEVSSP